MKNVNQKLRPSYVCCNIKKTYQLWCNVAMKWMLFAVKVLKVVVLLFYIYYLIKSVMTISPFSLSAIIANIIRSKKWRKEEENEKHQNTKLHKMIEPRRISCMSVHKFSFDPTDTSLVFRYFSFQYSDTMKNYFGMVAGGQCVACSYE